MKKKPSQAKEEFVRNNQGLPIMAEVISWSERGAQHLYKDVVAALRTAKIDETHAKEILPKQAFQRAKSKLVEDGVMDPLNKVGDLQTWQLTEKFLEDRKLSKEWRYSKKAEITLDTNTGKVTCAIPALEKLAQDEVNRAIEVRTNGDITKIVKSIFKSADANFGIISITENGGCYMVKAEHLHFCDKIDSFMKALGRRLDRIPIPKGDSKAEEALSNLMVDQVDFLAKKLEKEVDDFSTTTRLDTLEKKAEDIKKLRIEVEAGVHYLHEKTKDALAIVDEANKKLIAKVQSLAKERQNSPPKAARENGQGVIDYIEEKLREATPKKPLSEEAMLEMLKKHFHKRAAEDGGEGMAHTVRVQLRYPKYSTLMGRRGLTIVRTPKGYYIQE